MAVGTKTHNHGHPHRQDFGYDDMPVQGGMNDQGLFIDGNSLAPTGWKPDPGKPTFRGSVLMVLLGTCATCEDVKAFFEKSNVPALERARIPVADRSGASMVVEYGRGRVQFVRSRTWYQIATNFVMSNASDGHFPCRRYRAADKMLSEARELDVDLIRDMLETTFEELSAEGMSVSVVRDQKECAALAPVLDFSGAATYSAQRWLDSIYWARRCPRPALPEAGIKPQGQCRVCALERIF